MLLLNNSSVALCNEADINPGPADSGYTLPLQTV